MKEKKVAAVMGNHRQIALRSEEQLPWITDAFTPLIMRVSDGIPHVAKRVREPCANVLIKEEYGHYDARFAARRASIASL